MVAVTAALRTFRRILWNLGRVNDRLFEADQGRRDLQLHACKALPQVLQARLQMNLSGSPQQPLSCGLRERHLHKRVGAVQQLQATLQGRQVRGQRGFDCNLQTASSLSPPLLSTAHQVTTHLHEQHTMQTSVYMGADAASHAQHGSVSRSTIGAIQTVSRY